MYTVTEFTEIQYPNFYSVTYSQHFFHLITIGFSTIIFGVCFGLLQFITERKKLSWGLTLINSFVMTVFGTIYMYVKRKEVTDLFVSGKGAYELLHSIDDYSIMVCIWFALMNLADLLFGLMFYKKYLGFATAIIHHPFYIWLMITSITGNGGLFIIQPFSSALVIIVGLEELPTFILALGSMYTSLRTDLGFGVSFFLLRICFHCYIVYSTVIWNFSILSTILPCFSMVFHFYWFYTWCLKYGLKYIPLNN